MKKTTFSSLCFLFFLFQHVAFLDGKVFREQPSLLRDKISLHEKKISLAEYASFLNAVAMSDPFHLYDEKMASIADEGSILRSGEMGNYHYEVMGDGEIGLLYLDLRSWQRYRQWRKNVAPMVPSDSEQSIAGDFDQESEVEVSICNQDPLLKVSFPLYEANAPSAGFQGEPEEKEYWLKNLSYGMFFLLPVSEGEVRQEGITHEGTPPTETFTPEEEVLRQETERTIQAAVMRTPEELQERYKNPDRSWEACQEKWKAWHDSSEALRRKENELYVVQEKLKKARNANTEEALSQNKLGQIQKCLVATGDFLENIKLTPVQVAATVVHGVGKAVGLANHFFGQQEVTVLEGRQQGLEERKERLETEKQTIRAEANRLAMLSVQQEKEALIQEEYLTQELVEIFKVDAYWAFPQWRRWAEQIRAFYPQFDSKAVAHLAMTHPHWAEEISKTAWRQRIQTTEQRLKEWQQEKEPHLDVLMTAYKRARNGIVTATSQIQRAFQQIALQKEKITEYKKKIEVLAEAIAEAEDKDAILFARKQEEFKGVFQLLVEADASIELLEQAWQESLATEAAARAACWHCSQEYKLFKESYQRGKERIWRELQADEKAWPALWSAEKNIPYYSWSLPDHHENSAASAEEEAEIEVDPPQKSREEEILEGRDRIWLAKQRLAHKKNIVPLAVEETKEVEVQEISSQETEETKLAAWIKSIQTWKPSPSVKEQLEEEERLKALQQADHCRQELKHKKKELEKLLSSKKKKIEFPEAASETDSVVTPSVIGRAMSKISHAGRAFWGKPNVGINKEQDLQKELTHLSTTLLDAERKWIDLLQKAVPYFQQDHPTIPLPSVEITVEQDAKDPLLQAWREEDRKIIEHQEREKRRDDAVAYAENWERNHRRWNFRAEADKLSGDEKAEEVWRRELEESSLYLKTKKEAIKALAEEKINFQELDATLKKARDYQRLLDRAVNLRWELFQQENKQEEEGNHSSSEGIETLIQLMLQEKEMLPQERTLTKGSLKKPNTNAEIGVYKSRLDLDLLNLTNACWRELEKSRDEEEVWRKMLQSKVEAYEWLVQREIILAATLKIPGMEEAWNERIKESRNKKKEAENVVTKDPEKQSLRRREAWLKSIASIDEAALTLLKDEKKRLDHIESLWKEIHADRIREKQKTLARATRAFHQGQKNLWEQLDKEDWQEHRNTIAESNRRYTEEEEKRCTRLNEIDQEVDDLERAIEIANLEYTKAQPAKKPDLEKRKEQLETRAALLEKEWTQLFQQHESEQEALWAASAPLEKVEEYVRKESFQKEILRKAYETWRQEKIKAALLATKGSIEVRPFWQKSQEAYRQLGQQITKLRRERLKAQEQVTPQKEKAKIGEKLISLHEQKVSFNMVSSNKEKELLLLYQQAAENFATAARTWESYNQEPRSTKDPALKEHQKWIADSFNDAGVAYSKMAKQKLTGKETVVELHCEDAAWHIESGKARMKMLRMLREPHRELSKEENKKLIEYQKGLSSLHNNKALVYQAMAEQEELGNKVGVEEYQTTALFWYQKAIIELEKTIKLLETKQPILVEHYYYIADRFDDAGSAFWFAIKEKLANKESVAGFYREEAALRIEAAKVREELVKMLEEPSKELSEEENKKLIEYQNWLSVYNNNKANVCHAMAEQEGLANKVVVEDYQHNVLPKYEQAIIAVEKAIKLVKTKQPILAEHSYYIADRFDDAGTAFWYAIKEKLAGKEDIAAFYREGAVLRLKAATAREELIKMLEEPHKELSEEENKKLIEYQNWLSVYNNNKAVVCRAMAEQEGLANKVVVEDYQHNVLPKYEQAIIAVEKAIKLVKTKQPILAEHSYYIADRFDDAGTAFWYAIKEKLANKESVAGFYREEAALRIEAAKARGGLVKMLEEPCKELSEEENKKLIEYQKRLSIYKNNKAVVCRAMAEQEGLGNKVIVEDYQQNVLSWYDKAIIGIEKAVQLLKAKQPILAEHSYYVAGRFSNAGFAYEQTIKQKLASKESVAGFYREAAVFHIEAAKARQEMLASLQAHHEELSEYQERLSVSQNNMAYLYQDLGKQAQQKVNEDRASSLYHKALSSYQEAVQYRHQAIEFLKLQQKDQASHLKDLSLCYHRLGWINAWQGDQVALENKESVVAPLYQEALAAYEEAVQFGKNFLTAGEASGNKGTFLHQDDQRTWQQMGDRAHALFWHAAQQEEESKGNEEKSQLAKKAAEAYQKASQPRGPGLEASTENSNNDPLSEAWREAAKNHADAYYELWDQWLSRMAISKQAARWHERAAQAWERHEEALSKENDEEAELYEWMGEAASYAAKMAKGLKSITIQKRNWCEKGIAAYQRAFEFVERLLSALEPQEERNKKESSLMAEEDKPTWSEKIVPFLVTGWGEVGELYATISDWTLAQQTEMKEKMEELLQLAEAYKEMLLRDVIPFKELEKQQSLLRAKREDVALPSL